MVEECVMLQGTTHIHVLLKYYEPLIIMYDFPVALLAFGWPSPRRPSGDPAEDVNSADVAGRKVLEQLSQELDQVWFHEVCVSQHAGWLSKSVSWVLKYGKLPASNFWPVISYIVYSTSGIFWFHPNCLGLLYLQSTGMKYRFLHD